MVLISGAATSRGNSDKGFNDGERPGYCVTTDTLVNVTQWTGDEGGNGHWYAILPVILFWDEADIAAHTYLRDGVQGYLATVTSLEENCFIVSRVIADIDNNSAYDKCRYHACYQR